MGGKDSKLTYISFEDASRRVTEAELKRLKDAFKRSSSLNGLMTETQFLREVLWDGVPTKMAQLIYRAFGGTAKGLSFKDLLGGLVVLTKGSREEKIKFVFSIYADDSFTNVQKDEMDRRVLETEGQVSHTLSDLFLESDQVSYEHFKAWVIRHPQSTIISKWLLADPYTAALSSDSDTPTFFQTLAGVTHLEESDINELEKRYWVLKAQSKSGRFDLDTFKLLVSPHVPDTLCEGLFMAFDENRDNHIDFKEMACGISACCRGPSIERQKFCFKVFDTNHDSLLCEEELQSMLNALITVRKESNVQLSGENHDLYEQLDPLTVAKEILSCHDADHDGLITMEEYLVWTVNNTLSDDFLSLLSQICHIVLGLRPQTREEEGRIIKAWLEREDCKPLSVGQTWYLVAMQWWSSWRDYVSTEPASLPNGHILSANSSRSNSVDSNGRHRLSKVKANTVLAFDDSDTVVCVKLSGTELSRDNTNSITRNGSVTNSPRKDNLSPQQVYTHNRSPSPSPKLRKKPVGPALPQRPGAIDNNTLVITNSSKVMTLTNEGGRLKRDVMLAKGRDFELVPEPVWRCLSNWYGGAPALPRTVISSLTGDPTPELELYPITVKLLRHQVPTQRPAPTTTFTGMMAGIGGMALNVSNFAATHTQHKRYLAFTAAFSRRHTLQQIYEFLSSRLRLPREDIRVWKVKDEHNMTLLDDDSSTVEEASIEDNQQVLVEVRSKDLTWPEEMSQLAKNKNKKDLTPTEKGATGLNNLGNTCFMNAAVQCVSNTWPLTQYFTAALHRFELNRTNPLGMKGHIAQRYGELVKELWSGSSKTIAPLKLRWTIGKYAPRFNGFQQHDSQELLSFLLDGLHEDLNRVHDKPYVELKDSNGRPDDLVAKEAWDNHLLRNKSIIVDLFHGQLKSQVRCKECGHISVRFDPFNYLSLPLPMDSCIHLEIIVIRLDGSVPVKYGLRLTMDEKYKALKKELSDLTNIPTTQIMFVEIIGPIVKTLPQDTQKIRTLLGGILYAYEMPQSVEIEPMSVQEERALNARTAIGLNQIQRGVSTSKKSQSTINSTGGSGHLNGRPPQMDVNNTMDMQAQSLQPAVTDSPGHARYPSNASTNGVSESKSTGDMFNGFVIGVHRKMTHMDVYFLSSQKTRPNLFGTPIILPCAEETSNQDLYQFIWTQVGRLVSPLPPSEAKSPNHAQDCDDSLGYQYPFTLKVVQKDGFTCACCPWYKFCRGCKVECNSSLFKFGSSFLAIDWEPTALHLRYQTTHERFSEEHASVEESRRQQTEPIDLDRCLRAFTKEEQLGEDELYHCSKCKKHCLASKKLDIWRLPAILIINLKRFQFLNGRWVKSHKIVKFPLCDFDPTIFVAPRHTVKNGDIDGETNTKPIGEGHEAGDSAATSQKHDNVELDKTDQINENGCGDGYNAAAESREREHGVQSPVANYLDAEDFLNARYNLYALSCHSGILGGGHYVAYAKNPNSKWYCYNDSSCKEVQDSQMDTNSAYILFYEQQGVDFSHFMPDTTGKEPDTEEIVDEFESDFKKMCIIQ